LLHLVGDLFELYDDARTYKPKIEYLSFMVGAVRRKQIWNDFSDIGSANMDLLLSIYLLF